MERKSAEQFGIEANAERNRQTIAEELEARLDAAWDLSDLDHELQHLLPEGPQTCDLFEYGRTLARMLRPHDDPERLMPIAYRAHNLASLIVRMVSPTATLAFGDFYADIDSPHFPAKLHDALEAAESDYSTLMWLFTGHNDTVVWGGLLPDNDDPNRPRRHDGTFAQDVAALTFRHYDDSRTLR